MESKSKKHSWREGSVHGYQAVACSDCDYLVVAIHDMPDDLPLGQDLFLEEDGVIFTGAKRITAEDCEKLCKKYHAHCK